MFQGIQIAFEIMGWQSLDPCVAVLVPLNPRKAIHDHLIGGQLTGKVTLAKFCNR
jgi:hypothetical protein